MHVGSSKISLQTLYSWRFYSFVYIYCWQQRECFFFIIWQRCFLLCTNCNVHGGEWHSPCCLQMSWLLILSIIASTSHTRLKLGMDPECSNAWLILHGLKITSAGTPSLGRGMVSSPGMRPNGSCMDLHEFLFWFWAWEILNYFLPLRSAFNAWEHCTL